MVVKVKEENIILALKNGSIDILVHGCNCYNLMGAGIARIIAKEFPEAQAVDLETGVGDFNKLGSYTLAETSKGQVINAYTQFFPGKDFSYEALITFLKKLNEDFKDSKAVIGFPKIGCGIGGGNFDIVIALIDHYTPDLMIEIYDFN
jgi:O-acetyl-ADP-ribose deacetylase (regulator of RNase III)